MPKDCIISSLSYTPTPISRIATSTTERLGVELYLKREDMNHPFVSGNKWWKLKYNLLQAKRGRYDRVLTFGGAYSNHIYATAAATGLVGMESIGIIRGARALPLSPTLCFAQRMGMSLHFVGREAYRHKAEPMFTAGFRTRFGRFYLLPEGGTNILAIKGCRDWANEIYAEIAFDYLCIPVGTGGTLAGFISAKGNANIIGFSALKGGDFLYHAVKKNIAACEAKTNWTIETRYHFGGYGKTTHELTAFIDVFERRHNIPLDPVYTGKMMYGIFDLLQAGFFARRSRILVIHTGGLQGHNNKSSKNIL